MKNSINSSKIIYHPINQNQINDTNNQKDEQKKSLMGVIYRFIRFGGWRRNVLILISLTITLSFPFIFKYRNLSHQTDLSTVHSNQCIPPIGHPTHRYALMVDAGSTGSRIHVYRFSYCLESHHLLSSSSSILPKLDHELFFKTQPGLSSFVGRPEDAANSLLPLLQAASEGVPKELQHCTPISVKATAGLRLLGERQSKEILDHIYKWISTSWPFKLSSSNSVSIMDGSEEGVYAWVTINYLLKTIGPTETGEKESRTAAIMDLGGASTQIVFEPLRSKLEPGKHVYDLKFSGKTHSLYQHSHLGYGLMEARRAVHQLIAYSEIWRRKINFEDLSKKVKGPIGNPCLQPGTYRKVELIQNFPSTSSSSKKSDHHRQVVNFFGTGQGFNACRRVVSLMIGKDAICNLKPCAFGGVYQPNFADAFSDGPIYALSYIYDRLNPLGIETSFKLKGIEKLITLICLRDKRNDEEFTKKIIALKNSLHSKDEGLSELNEDQILAELDDRPESCLDLTFIFELLNLGYQINPDRRIIISKKISEVELGWTLGAAIDLLEHSPVDQCKM